MKVYNNNGFSLVSVLVAMGIAGGLAVFLMKLGSQQSKVSATSMASADIQQIFTVMNRELLSQTGCTNSLSPLGNLKTTTSFSQVFNHRGIEV